MQQNGCDFVLDAEGTTCDKPPTGNVIITALDEYDEGYDMTTYFCADHADNTIRDADLIATAIADGGDYANVKWVVQQVIP